MSNAGVTGDGRNIIYKNLHANQLQQEKATTAYSSRRVLEMLFKLYQPQSVLDVGCGLGMWLKTASELGVPDVRGIEGVWVDPALLEIPPERVQIRDLEKGFDLDRKFDLVICLEVAEHLSPGAAETLVGSLVRHAPVVVFSAAVPFQGGEHHVNEQFLPYWATKFAQHDYRPVDLFRRELWEDSNALLWLRQNVVLFAHEGVLAANEALHRASLDKSFPLSVVHPEFYIRRVQEDEAVLAHLRAGGFYQVIPTANTADLAILRVTEGIEEMRKLRDMLQEGGLFQATKANATGEFRVVRTTDSVEELEKLRDYMQPGGLFYATSDKPGGFRVSKASDSIAELQILKDYIATGGLFRVTVNASGSLTVRKVEEPAPALTR
jgi:SAM-dependent methyltransferase